MQLISEKTFAITMLSPVAASAVTLPFVLIMHFTMLRAILDRYWREPYFRPGELAFFTGTLYAPMRTVMLMSAIAFPRLGKRRGVSEVRLLAPKWYRVASILVVLYGIGSLVGILVLGVGFVIYFQAIGQPIQWVR